MSSFKVPYAINENGKLVTPRSAIKSTKYQCPSCESPLIFKSGEIKAKHFAHSASSTCSAETVEHKTAKLRLINAIDQHNLIKKNIKVYFPCQDCGKVLESEIDRGKMSYAKEEVRVENYISDVVIYDKNEKPILALEVRKTHPVDHEKSCKLNLSWLELNADSIINNPYVWYAINGNINKSLCDSCETHRNIIHKVCDIYKINSDLYTTIQSWGFSNYIAETDTCYSCKEEVPIFWWDHEPIIPTKKYDHDLENIIPPEPRPHTIKLKQFKKLDRLSWCNTCANCEARFSDNFIKNHFEDKLVYSRKIYYQDDPYKKKDEDSFIPAYPIELFGDIEIMLKHNRAQ
jgi:hypothetical protein